MKEAYKKYIENGFACLPTNEDKEPPSGVSWKSEFNEEAFGNTHGIGIKCGEKSNGLECIDFDNHFGDAQKRLSDYLAVEEVLEIYKKHKLPIESTVRNGFHLLFRCEVNEGNKKLARKILIEDGKEKPTAFIETKGEGGYFVASPSPGYKVVRNDIFSVAVISPEERKVLIETAISMNEYAEDQTPKQPKHEGEDRPGDIYNASIEAIQETKNLLAEAGWVEARSGKWRRPGKKRGISATFGFVGDMIFYVFTANGHPFEDGKCYTPFQVLAILKYNGDFTETAKMLAERYKPVIEKKKEEQEVNELDELLVDSSIDTAKEIKAPPTILSVVERGAGQLEYRRLFTLGNFSAIIGKAKTKKTFFLTMLASSLLSNCHDKFMSQLNGTEKKKILWFDTEQGAYDSYNTLKRVEKMAGDISNMRAFTLRQYSPKERCGIIERAFEKWGHETAFCVIDGIADLANGINDEEEATRVATMLLRLTKIYDCHISIVIHQNKNDNFATGHLGSALMKKSEIIVSVMKNENNKYITDVNCDLSRGIDFETFAFLIKDGLPEVCKNVQQETKPFFNGTSDRNDEIEPIVEDKNMPF